ncbi:MAG: META domain-containing protein [Xanthomonadales bacterium]|nr:META domain-containing protein [Xanthomonadales bacterium]
MTKPSSIVPALLACALAACAGTGSSGKAASQQQAPATSPVDAATQLPRYHWKLQDARASDGGRIDALFARDDKPLTLDFADGRVSVRNACNGIGGNYALDGDTLTFGPMMGTMMACADPRLTALDGAVTTRLTGKARIALDAGASPALKITTVGGDILTFAGEPVAPAKG